MTRQLEQVIEEKNAKRAERIVRAVEYELVGAVQRAGAEFLGFTAVIKPAEVLLVLKVNLAGRRQVAFVGSEDLGGALIKAVRLASADQLVWKEDKFANGG